MLNANRPIIFSIVLICISLLSISIRYFFYDPAKVPPGDSIWELHWEFAVDESVMDDIIRLATPSDSKYNQVFEQKITVQGMQIKRSRVGREGTREIVARVTRPQDVGIIVDFAVHQSPIGIPHYVKQQDVLNTERRQSYISPLSHIPSRHKTVHELLEELTLGNDEQIRVFNSIFEYCHQKIKTVEANAPDVLDAITLKRANVQGKVRLLVTLARAANIPARMVMGLVLEEQKDIEPYYWAEINIDGDWLAYDPNEGYEKEVPFNYLPVRKNGEDFLNLPGTTILDHFSLEIAKRDVTIDLFGGKEKSLSDILDLNRLSLSTRLSLAFLLLLPLGALLTVFIRQIIGPNVYGTFTPTFFAIAFSQIDWKTGAIILSMVTIFGIIGRSITPLLGLNRVSRLTMVFILVAITMIFSVSIMVHYGLVPDGSIVLLPIVILTFMIDRIYRLADSDGVKVAMTRLFWTFVVSAMVLTIVQFDMLGLWLLKYPEAHLLTAASVIFISQYKGQKWMMKFGLGWMLEPEKTRKSKTDELDS